MHPLKSARLVAVLAFALIVVFAIGRLPLYAGYFIPWYAPDSTGYFAEAYRLATGESPQLGIRTPGYPLFLFAVLSVTGSISSIIVMQQAATLAAGLGLYAALVKARRWLALPAAAAVAGVFASGDLVLYESYMGPESLYASALIASLACLLIALVRRKAWTFACTSALMAVVVLLKPAGMFMVVIYVVLVVALWIARYPRQLRWAFGLPLPLILGGLAAYNAANISQFTVSPWGSANLVAATSPFWKDSPDYPAEVRAAIRDMESRLTPADRMVLATSWNPTDLFAIYSKCYNASVHVVLRQRFMPDPGDPRVNALLKRISFDAIRANPIQYSKFVYTNAYEFFYVAPQAYYSFAFYLEERYRPLFVKPQTVPSTTDPSLRKYMLREFLDPTELANFRTVRDSDATRIEMNENGVLRLHKTVSSELFPILFDADVWLVGFVAFVVVLAASMARPRMRLATPEVYVLSLTAILMLVGAGLVVSLVELGIARYAAPTRFVYFLSLPLGTWLLVEFIADISRREVPNGSVRDPI